MLALLEAGHSAIIVDDLSNSFPQVFARLQKLAGDNAGNMKFVQADAGDAAAMEKVFAEDAPEAVIHFAGFKAVAESMEKPVMYYQ